MLWYINDSYTHISEINVPNKETNIVDVTFNVQAEEEKISELYCKSTSLKICNSNFINQLNFSRINN